jgi:hypothetical protein
MNAAVIDDEATPLSGIVIRITRAHTTTRSYDAIQLYLGGLHLSQDITCDRHIRLAALLAKKGGVDMIVSPELQARVDAALREGGRRG